MPCIKLKKGVYLLEIMRNPMTDLTIRQHLFEYIRFADEKKIKAFYTIVEDEIKEKHPIWTKEFASEMEKRSLQMQKGKVGKDWNSVKSKARAILSKTK